MTTESLDPKLRWLLQYDWREKFIPDLGKETWITVYYDQVNKAENLGIVSALIPNQFVQTSLSQIGWDLGIGDDHPRFVVSQGSPIYLRFGNLDEIEPFVIHRSFNGLRDSYNEILEEFRHFHNLYHDFERNELIKFNEGGNEIVVAKIQPHKVEVRLKEVRQFLAVKEMHLGIYFDFKRYSDLVSNDFPVRLPYKDHLTCYELRADSDNYLHDNKKSWSHLMGKKLIPPFPLERCGIWPFDEIEEKDYVDFIIALDEHGEPIKYSCNPDGLANYFGANPDAPNYLTPVFFRREVLTKYYSHPERYSVEDGFLRCKRLWGLHIDNNHPEYIIVFLGDLGRDLSSDEQRYWSSYNIPPEGKISKTNFLRNFSLTPAEPEQIDLIFKSKFKRFSESWEGVMGWKFFQEFAEEDRHNFDTLRIPLTNDQAEFDAQILALTKVMIDSLNEKEIVKATSGGNTEIEIVQVTSRGDTGHRGINKLEQFLNVHQYQQHEYIQWLRDLQKLRSKGAAHRKGEEYPKLANRLGLNKSNLADVMKEFLGKATEFLRSLEEHFLQPHER